MRLQVWKFWIEVYYDEPQRQWVIRFPKKIMCWILRRIQYDDFVEFAWAEYGLD